MYLLFLGLAALPAFAQTPSDWAAVRQRAPNTPIAVESTAGNRTTGKLSSVSEATLMLNGDSIPRDTIATLHRVTPPRHRTLATVAGAGLGLAAGIAAAVPTGFKQCGQNCTGETAAIAGALLGHQLAGRNKLELIYTKP